MSKRLTLLFLCVFALPLSAQDSPNFVPGELIVQVESPSFFGRLFSSSDPISEISEKYNASATSVYLKERQTGIQAFSYSNKTTYKVSIPQDQDIEKAAAELALYDRVTLVQKNQLFYLSSTPNDPEYLAGNQAYIPLLNIDDAWSITQGDQDVVVAVIDSGVAYTHPDLAAQIWSNPEISGGIDSDGNDQNMDIRGWDFGSSDVGDNDPLDNNGHGTAVSGIISAHTNNDEGIAGVGYNLSILPIKVTNSSGDIDTLSLTNAIYYAVEKNVDIINMSLGGPLEDDENILLSNAVASAIDAGIIVVAAAGNVVGSSGFDIDEYRIVPATLPDVIAVSATDLTGEFATSTSLFGESVDFAAPGVGVRSTAYGPFFSTHGYDDFRGTSFSAPIVSGVIGLMLSHETDATLSDIYSSLQNSAVDKGSTGHDIYYGHGLVDAQEALNELKSGPNISISSDLSTYFSTSTDFVISLSDSQGVATDSIRVTLNTTEDTLVLTTDSAGVTYESGLFTISLSLLVTIPEGSAVTIEVYAEDTTGEITQTSKTYQQDSNFLLFGHNGPGSSIVNAPNPFAPRLETTSFCFEITQPAYVEISVYSLNLEKVRDVYSGTLNAGYHDTIYWDGRDESGDYVPNGVYVFVLSAESDGKRIVKRNRIAVLAR